MRISDWSSDVCSSDLLGAGDLVLQLGHVPFDEALAFARGVVFRVLGEVAVLARFGDGANDLGARRRLEITQLFFQAGETARRHGYFIAHGSKPSTVENTKRLTLSRPRRQSESPPQQGPLK